MSDGLVHSISFLAAVLGKPQKPHSILMNMTIRNEKEGIHPRYTLNSPVPGGSTGYGS
jgi:hypothetical protein